ncbi:MAG: VWA domain-containing protein [Oligoflexia bacterium]|nr:VWA domain-containing protein [Oligoflexia bacterium]
MKSRFSSRNLQALLHSSSCEERGTFLVIMAGSFLVFLAILGFAIDVAKIQATQLRVQRAVDASAVAATYLIEDNDRINIQNTAEKILRDNLHATGITDSEIPALTVEILPPLSANPLDPPPAVRRLKISAQVNSPTILFSIIPGFQDSGVVYAAAESTDKRVAAVLTLDVSGSMLDVVPCGTLPGPTCRKIDHLKVAAKAFVDLFGPQDRLALVTFSGTANVAYPMTKNPDKQALENAIDGLTAIGYTGAYQGLLTARGEMNSAVNNDLTPTDSKSIVFVSDGAPYGDNGAPTSAPAVPPVPTGCLNLSGNSTFNRDIYSKRRYIGAIAQADLARDENTVVHAIGLGPLGTLTGSVCPDPAGTSTFSSYQQSDPFQCSGFDDIVKTFFLARLTNDQAALVGNPYGSPAIPPNPDFPTSCVATNAAIASKPQGRFYQTANASDLTALLLAIGRGIRARLTK